MIEKIHIFLLSMSILALLIPICRVFANSVDLDLLASKKPIDLDIHCLLLRILIYINNPDQITWLAEN